MKANNKADLEVLSMNRSCPMPFAWENKNKQIANITAPARKNGRRRPNFDSLWSLKTPIIGWNMSPVHVDGVQGYEIRYMYIEIMECKMHCAGYVPEIGPRIHA